MNWEKKQNQIIVSAIIRWPWVADTMMFVGRHSDMVVGLVAAILVLLV